MSNTAITEQTGSLRQILNSDAGKAQFAAALPKHMTPERFCRVAITALTRTPKLAECSKESFFKCLMDLSAMGLEPDGRRAHLIPYGKECTLIVDYKGLAELVMRSGLVSAIHSDRVCDKDIFEADRGKLIRHKIDYRSPRGEAYAYYVLVTFKDGTEKFEVMTKDEIDAVRKRSRASNSGPWQTDYDEMAKKTVFRRASKWLSLSPEIRTAIEYGDEDHLAANTLRAAEAPPAVKSDYFTEGPTVDVGGTAQEVEPADQDGADSDALWK